MQSNSLIMLHGWGMSPQVFTPLLVQFNSTRTEAPGPGENPVVRFKTPGEGEIVIDDQVRGEVVVSNQELDDLIIAANYVGYAHVDIVHHHG